MNKMKPFTKLFSSIVTSSIWTENAHTKVVWVTMLALADADGDVWASVGGLAKAAGVTREQCAAALERFLAPDPDSRTKEYEGRRITVVDGGWRLLNYKKYREMGRSEDRREYFREKKREQRARPHMSTHVHTCPQSSTGSTMSTDIEAEAEAEADTPPAAAGVVAPARPSRPPPPGGSGGARSRIQGIDREAVRQAVEAGDALACVSAFRGSRGPEIDAGWLRDAAGMMVGVLATVLWLAFEDGKPIRMPSGLRPARKAWDDTPPGDRRELTHAAFASLGIPWPEPPPQSETVTA